jgi:hypothetical protein
VKIVKGKVAPKRVPPNVRYPWATLKVDEAITVDPVDAHRAACAAANFKRRHPGWDYATQTTPNDFWIWRIK